MFGALGVVIIHFIQPHVMKLLSFFSDLVLNVSADVIAVALTVDLLITLRRLVDFSVSMAKIQALGETLRERFGKEAWFHGESITQVFASVHNRYAEKKDEFNAALIKKVELLQPKIKNIESFIHRFPTLKSLNYHEELLKLKERFHKKNNRK